MVACLYDRVPPRRLGFGCAELIILSSTAISRIHVGRTSMQNLRLLLVAGLALAVGSTLAASAQETAPRKAQSQTQAQDKKNDNGHRKHWWSLPHMHHKKKQDV